MRGLFFTFVAVVSWAAVVAAQEEPARAEGADRTWDLGGALQAGYGLYPNAAPDRRNGFFVSHARLRLRGAWDQVSLVLRGDVARWSDGRANRIGGEMEQDGPPVLLDAYGEVAVPQLGMTVRIGRFVPRWGHVMPEPPWRLGTGVYPLYLHGNSGSFGEFWTLGVEAAVSLGKGFSAIGGVFNGGGWWDSDDGKDILVGLQWGRGLWSATAAARFFVEKQDESPPWAPGTAVWDARGGAPVLEVSRSGVRWHVDAGAALRRVRVLTPDGDRTRGAVGAFGQVRWHPLAPLSILVRFDALDPDWSAEDDYQVRWVVGPGVSLPGDIARVWVHYVLDRFGSPLAMCRTHLEDPLCAAPGGSALPATAATVANSLLVFFVIDAD